MLDEGTISRFIAFESPLSVRRSILSVFEFGDQSKNNGCGSGSNERLQSAEKLVDNQPTSRSPGAVVRVDSPHGSSRFGGKAGGG